MPYGTHWEWRGFGTLDQSVRERITRLPRAYPTPHSVTDQYVWMPGLKTNIKLRSWPGGASLKFKRLLSDDARHGVQLWMEREEEDYQFPIAPAAIANLQDELKVELGMTAGRWTDETLLTRLRAAGAQLVRISKLRWLFRWQRDARLAFVDLAELSCPVRTFTVGVEDALGITDAHDARQTGEARDLVLEARESLGLPDGLTRLSYLEAVASWQENGFL